PQGSLLRRGAAQALKDRLEADETQAHRATRVPSYLRRLHDRRRGQRQSAVLLHGPLLDYRDPRPLRPSDAGGRSRGSRDAGRLPRARGGGLATAPIRSSKPAGRGNPTLGWFDSIAAPWRKDPALRVVSR